jgi:CubicO group peptidase (beta-lactamase class C family)
MARIVILLFSILIFSSCLKDDELKKPFISYQPRQLSDGWTISSPEAEKIDATGLTQVYRDFHSNDLWQVRSMLVFRNGKLVAESYTKDDNDITTPRAVWSETKQVVGFLTGIALEQQMIKDINDPISEYLPEVEKFQDKKNITIENLLTMRSGIKYSNDELSGQTDDILRKLPEKVIDFILGRPMANPPGENAQYKDCDPQLVSAIIQKKCGKPTSQWAKEVLFDKLEIENLEWNSYKDGVTLGGFGILTTPRELAKIGQCVMDSGRWKGVHIVNKAWIKEMTTVRIQDMYGYQFCYLWWKDKSRNMTMMCGHGGQYVCILPEKELIVVMTAEVNTQGDFQFRFDEAFKWVDRIAKIAN